MAAELDRNGPLSGNAVFRSGEHFCALMHRQFLLPYAAENR
jgi:hypothetical protein